VSELWQRQSRTILRRPAYLWKQMPTSPAMESRVPSGSRVNIYNMFYHVGTFCFIKCAVISVLAVIQGYLSDSLPQSCLTKYDWGLKRSVSQSAFYTKLRSSTLRLVNPLAKSHRTGQRILQNGEARREALTRFLSAAMEDSRRALPRLSTQYLIHTGLITWNTSRHD
jgi:hypothetical protein